MRKGFVSVDNGMAESRVDPLLEQQVPLVVEILTLRSKVNQNREIKIGSVMCCQ